MVCVCARGLYCSCDRWSIDVVCVGHQFMTSEIHDCMAQAEYRCCVYGASVHDFLNACYSVIGILKLKVNLSVTEHCTESSKLFSEKWNQLAFKRRHFQNKFVLNFSNSYTGGLNIFINSRYKITQSETASEETGDALSPPTSWSTRHECLPCCVAGPVSK